SAFLRTRVCDFVLGKAGRAEGARRLPCPLAPATSRWDSKGSSSLHPVRYWRTRRSVHLPRRGLSGCLAGFARPGAGKHYVKLVRSPEAAHFWRNPSTDFTGMATILQGVCKALSLIYRLCF